MHRYESQKICAVEQATMGMSHTTGKKYNCYLFCRSESNHSGTMTAQTAMA